MILKGDIILKKDNEFSTILWFGGYRDIARVIRYSIKKDYQLISVDIKVIQLTDWFSNK